MLVVIGLMATGILSLATPASATPPLPDTVTEYWFGNWELPTLWAQGATGQGITVAVLDTGVQASQPELAGVVLPGTDLMGGDGGTDTDTPNGHGTQMALLIAGQGGVNDLVGAAPDAKILPVTVNPGGDTSTTDGLTKMADGIRYAVAHGAKVINISQGAPGDGYPDNCPTPVADAVRYAIGMGSVVLASAGNEGDADNQAEFPAACPGVIAVGAVGGSDKQVWPQTQRQPYVDLAAPGIDIPSEDLSHNPGISSGTSDSSALASAAVALVWSKFPDLTNRQVVARLLATVTPAAGQTGKNDTTGYGIVRPHVAISTDVPLDAANPIFDELDTPSTAASTTPASGAGAPPGSPASSPGGRADGASASSSGSSGAVIGIVAAVVVVVLALTAIIVLARRRRRRAAAAPHSAPPGS